MRKIPLVLFTLLFILSCGSKNIKLETQNIESQTSKKRLKITVSNVSSIEPKYFIYLINSLKSKIISSTEFIPAENNNYEILANLLVEGISETILPITNKIILRLDIIGTINLETINKEIIISNYSLTQTIITNSSIEVLQKSFLMEEFLDIVRYQTIDEFALNVSSVMYKGWRENYGSYTVTNTLIRSIIGGGDETNTTKTQKRNIPTIGGE